MNNLTLGLDLGTNSIGWALIEYDDNQRPQKLVACGSRIFQEAVEAKTGTPKNHARRAARAARKLVARRKQRRNKLLNLLIGHHLLPADEIQRDILLLNNQENNPYQLRKRGLNERLEPFALGRALYHLAQRRGFQSNRKARDEKEDGKVKSAITSLRADMQAAHCRTLGEYLASQIKQRKRYTDRAMYTEEFDTLWQAQQAYHPDLLLSALKVAIRNTIFFQRPLKSQKHLVGKCTFEPKRKRAAKATLLTQRCRILQDVNHLTVKNPVTREYRPLTQEERKRLVDALNKQKSMAWETARKILGWNKVDSLHEGETFNLEDGKKCKLLGNHTAYDLRNALGERWDALSEQQQDSLITDMLTIDNVQGFLNRMQTHWGFDAATAESLAKIELEPGYARLSAKAMRSIVPYLQQGMIYSDACKAAGYDHSKPKQQTITDKLGLPIYVRNPVVQKALFETRKVVNAVVRQYGKPSIIRVEMARDMKLSKRQKDDMQKEQNVREKANEQAEKILRNEFGIRQPSRADIQKYHMWQECKEVCPYTGTLISREMLFSAEVDVEHILPYSRSLDDSYMNKTLCMAGYNRQVKHNQTPYEIGQGNPLVYAEIYQRVKMLPFPKRRRFEQKDIDTDAFVTRQLNDTRYICVEVKDFLQQLGAPVEVSKGEATATLRYRWQLNTLLSVDGNNVKNRADHRHHAIDAVVIALTNRPLFQSLSRLSAQSGAALSERGFDLPQPWEGFYNDVYEKIDTMIVSHAPARKISGALHEATAYGYSDSEKCFVYRKPLDKEFTLAQVNKIRDGEVKRLVIARLKEIEPSIERALDESLPKKERLKMDKKREKEIIKQAFGNPENPLLHKDSNTQIRSVRIKDNSSKAGMLPIKDRHGKEYKFYPLGNNHHIEILQHKQEQKKVGVVISAIEALHRAHDGLPVINRNGPWQFDGVSYSTNDWTFVMSLAINDVIAKPDKSDIFRIQKISGNTQIFYLPHTAATLDESVSKLPNTFDYTKVGTDPLGNLTLCND
jgi:CRISPR-associated endonuclease Csn1